MRPQTTPARLALMPAAPWLELGFRPFFLAGAVWLAAATPYWLWLLMSTQPGWSRFDALAWHQHELILGGFGAIVAGFLLTAAPNWTGRPALHGTPLLALLVLWATARAANLTSAHLPAGLAPLLDVGFLVIVTGFVLHTVLVAGNRRNLPVVGLVALFTLAGLASHLAALGAPVDGALARRLAIAVLALLVGLIGGRIVPVFTTNWLHERGVTQVPAPFGRLDQASLALLALALASWTVAPAHVVTAWLALVAAIAQLVRLTRWQGHRTLAEPLITVLHLGYAWLAFGLLAIAAATLAPPLAGLNGTHALAAGTFGTMTLAVMTRASLGHTGRPLTADRGTVAIYASVTLGALVRVTGDAIGLDPTIARMLAVVFWSGAYALFVLHYGPMLLRPRADAAEPARAT